MLNQSQIAQLQKLHNFIIIPHHQVNEIYSKLKIPNLNKLISLEQQKLGYRLVNKLLPENLENLLKTDHKGTHLDKKYKYNTRYKTE